MITFFDSFFDVFKLSTDIPVIREIKGNIKEERKGL
jgi:hypothetical protein